MALNRLIDAELMRNRARPRASSSLAGWDAVRCGCPPSPPVALLVLAAINLSPPCQVTFGPSRWRPSAAAVHEALHLVLLPRLGAHAVARPGGRVVAVTGGAGAAGLVIALRRRPVGGRLTSSTRSSIAISTAPRDCTRCRWAGRARRACGGGRVPLCRHERAASGRGLLSGLDWIYWLGLVVVAVVLAWPHVDIARRGLRRVGMGFMTVNGAVGLLYGAVVIVAVLVGWSGLRTPPRRCRWAAAAARAGRRRPKRLAAVYHGWYNGGARWAVVEGVPLIVVLPVKAAEGVRPFA